jgi:hypothetical protein
MPGAGLIFQTVTTGYSSYFNSSNYGSSVTPAVSNINAANNSYWNGSVYFPDVMRNPFNIGIGTVASSSLTTYSVEVSFDDYTLPTFTASAGNWYGISGLTSASGNNTGNIAYPVRMVRLNVIGGTSSNTSSNVTFTLNVIQAAGD